MGSDGRYVKTVNLLFFSFMSYTELLISLIRLDNIIENY